MLLLSLLVVVGGCFVELVVVAVVAIVTITIMGVNVSVVDTVLPVVSYASQLGAVHERPRLTDRPNKIAVGMVLLVVVMVVVAVMVLQKRYLANSGKGLLNVLITAVIANAFIAVAAIIVRD